MKYLHLCLLCMLASCAVVKPQAEPVNPYLSEKIWRSMDDQLPPDPASSGWKEFHFLVVHNPLDKAISTIVDCDMFIAPIVVPPHSEVELLLSDDDKNCITR